MVRAKKEKLSLEELMEQALVKEEAQPYKIPNNWVWTELEYIAKWGSGGTPARKNPDFYEGDIPWIKTGELNNSYIYDTEEKITEEAIKKSSAKLFPANTVAIAMYGATIGKVGIFGVEAATNQACACAVTNSAVQYKWLFYYLQSQRQAFIDKGKGGAQPNISQEVIKRHWCPLSPLAEQQRIVERIEFLFEKLDTAKELVQNVLDSFENRKAAILHKAFEGELTAKWREENGVRLNSWEEKSLSELCDAFQYGTSKKSQDEGKVIVLRMRNLQKGEINWGNLVYTSDEEDIEKYLLKEGDVLFNRTNSAELVGKTSIYRGEHPAIFAGYLIRLKYKSCLNGEYLNYMLNSQRAKVYCSEVKSDGVNQSNINAKKIGQFIMPLCGMDEQEEIVKIVSRLLDNEQQAEELCGVVDKIDIMKKTILARAFRGELGTNNPEEESAENLLREILEKKYS